MHILFTHPSRPSEQKLAGMASSDAPLDDDHRHDELTRQTMRELEGALWLEIASDGV